jgi:hypothetical protein
MACDHEWCKLCNCAYDTKEYENDIGCELFIERPYCCTCNITKERKKELELLEKAYRIIQDNKKTTYVAFSGANGKYVVAP